MRPYVALSERVLLFSYTSTVLFFFCFSLLITGQSVSRVFPTLTFLTGKVDFLPSLTSLGGLSKEEIWWTELFVLKSLANYRLIGKNWAKAAVRG